MMRSSLPSHVVTTATLLALCGAATLTSISLNDGPFDKVMGHSFGELLQASTLGAALAGLFLAGLFGLQGGRGIVLASLGAILATCLGSGLGATLVLGSEGLALGPIFVLGGLFETPLTLPVWIAGMILTHRCAQAERDVPGS